MYDVLYIYVYVCTMYYIYVYVCTMYYKVFRLIRKISLPIVSSIMTVELHAILLSLGIINDTPYNNYDVCSDAMSSVQSIDNIFFN